MNILPLSYHGGHSAEFCDHAQPSTLRQVVETYLSRSFTYFGLSEHQPRAEAYLYPDERALGHDSDYLFSRFEAYIREARLLQEEFAQEAEILVGFETEFCDELAVSLIKDLRDRYAPDYVVGSLHHVQGIPIDSDVQTFRKAVQQAGSLEKLFIAYYDQQYQLIKECQPEVIGHFDLIRLFADDDQSLHSIEKLQRRNIEAVCSYGGVFEVNSRAFYKGLAEPYPSARVLDLIAECGGEVTLGDDSHGPEQVGLHYERVLPFVSSRFDTVVAFRRTPEGLEKIQLGWA